MLVLWQCIIFYWVQWSSPYPCHVNALKYFILICIFLSWILIVLLPTPFECSDSLCSFLWSLTDLRTLFHFLLHSIWLDCYSRSSWKTAWFIEVNCSLKRKKKKNPERKCGLRYGDSSLKSWHFLRGWGRRMASLKPAWFLSESISKETSKAPTALMAKSWVIKPVQFPKIHMVNLSCNCECCPLSVTRENGGAWEMMFWFWITLKKRKGV